MKVLGIEAVALNPGSSFRGIHDSLVNYESGHKPNPEMILCCHEEIAVAVAHGYFKATGKIMPAIVHNVVGLQHASMAIYNAWCDRTPVMVMGGTGPMNSSKRRPWIDWIHTAQVQGNIVRDFVKWDDQPFGVEAIPSSIMRGYRIAMSDPHGPVYLCFDVSDQEAAIEKEIPLPDPSRFRPPAPLQAEAEAIKEAARLLASAQNPVIIADYVGRALPAFGASRRYRPALLQCGQSNDIINAKPFPLIIANSDSQEILLIKFVELRQSLGGGVQSEADRLS
jgi:thiamine pyrophosphate-dependent acetolactate synthase large subunit-like protein